MIMLIVAVVAIALCACGSFFFALAETAFFSLGKWRLQKMAEEPGAGQQLRQFLDHPEEVLATIVFGNAVSNAGIIGVGLWIALQREWPVLLTGIILLALILLWGEAVPKTLAIRSPEKWSIRLLPSMTVVREFSQPFRRLAIRINDFIIKAIIPASIRPRTDLSDQEYETLIEMAFQQGTLAQAEKEIILQIINLDRRTVADVMRPRSRMVCIADDLTVEEMIAVARKTKHSRIPMYDETPDTIVGILNTHALLLDPKRDLEEVVEFPSFVPASMNLLQLFKSLQRQRRGLAIVLDEFGGTAGLVTMEDILESTIGEFRSEVGGESSFLEKTGNFQWRATGNVLVEDFRREFPDLPPFDQADTLNGLMLYKMEVVPVVGQSVAFGGLLFTASVVEDRRIREVSIQLERSSRT